ncbi:ribonuclease T2 [Rhizobium aethiopicum]|uniref:Ribonuclease T2 n=1 Tax=Rhizobium aethiopicum TaxID=1138170 RepID=A0A7W6QBZ3_9HYPH|nr:MULTISPECIES: ribonuclease [Rhizobium]MBB4194723.1 ribonuclease T2 [Rhizobium aethiopicum]MBB4582393.1 ribonuclease T2 [Rhizobium aethiopicum]MDO3435269.1 ribonuclease [Rhizobium sp. CBN3]
MSSMQLRTFTFAVSMILAGAAVAQEAEGRTRFILAASWQPAFCQTNQKKPECASQTGERHDATNFSLHGLWPMRQDYCGVSDDQKAADKDGKWDTLPDVALSAETQASLAKAMPGTQSGLERHEWIKHGTCTKMSVEEYFGVGVHLVEALNASAVRDLFAANIGKTVKAEAVKAAFDKSFGPGAGERVKMSCRRAGNARVISELTIGLSADAGTASAKSAGLADLIQGAGKTSFGCDEGVVDAAGF